jgi:hypothetical protein
MALTPKQQKKSWRPMIDRAWRAHCDRECITDSTEASKESWYREELKKCCGVTSSTQLDPRCGFEQGMAHFEELCNDGSFYWQTRSVQGDANRARHKLDETVKLLHMGGDYIAAIMAQMKLEKPLRQCTANELVKLRVALLYHCRRTQARTVQKVFSKGIV